MRTFLRSELDAANAAWTAGRFSPEWRAIRHKAAMGGLIYPPAGDKHDSWEDDNPSQRAILIRAIRESPTLLDKCVIRAPSWHVVIERLLRYRDEWREELGAKDRDAVRRRQEEEPTPRTAVLSIAQILERIADSR